MTKQDFTVKERELLEGVMISMYSSGSFYSKAKLNIDGYILEVPSKQYDTLQEATTGIMERIAEAVVKFKPE